MAHNPQGTRPSLGPTAAGDPPRYAWTVPFSPDGEDLTVAVNGATLDRTRWTFRDGQVHIDPVRTMLRADDTIRITRDTPITRVTSFEDSAYVRGIAGEAAIERVHRLLAELADEVGRLSGETDGTDALTGLLFDTDTRTLRAVRRRGGAVEVDLSPLVTRVGGIAFTLEQQRQIEANRADIARTRTADDLAARIRGIPDGRLYTDTDRDAVAKLQGDVASIRTPTPAETLARYDASGALRPTAAQLAALANAPTTKSVEDDILALAGQPALRMREALARNVLAETVAQTFTNAAFTADRFQSTTLTLAADTVVGIRGASIDPVLVSSDAILALPATPSGDAAIAPANGITFRVSAQGVATDTQLRLGRLATNALIVQLSATDAYSFQVATYTSGLAATRQQVQGWFDIRARAGNADPWPASKVPSLTALGGLSQAQVNAAAKVQAEAVTEPWARPGGAQVPRSRIAPLIPTDIPPSYVAPLARRAETLSGQVGWGQVGTPLDPRPASLPTRWQDVTGAPAFLTASTVVAALTALTGTARLAATALRDIDWSHLANKPPVEDGDYVAGRLADPTVTATFPIARTSGVLPWARLTFDARRAWAALNALGDALALGIVQRLSALTGNDRLPSSAIRGVPTGTGTGARTDISVRRTYSGAFIQSSTGSAGHLPLADANSAGLMSPAQHDVLDEIEDHLETDRSSHSGINARALVRDVFGDVPLFNTVNETDVSRFIAITQGSPTSFTEVPLQVAAGTFTRFTVGFDYLELNRHRTTGQASVSLSDLVGETRRGTGVALFTVRDDATLHAGMDTSRDTIRLWWTQTALGNGDFHVRWVTGRSQVSDAIDDLDFEAVDQSTIGAPDTADRRPVRIATEQETATGTDDAVLTTSQVLDLVRRIQWNGADLPGPVTTINFISNQ